jgi:hypothetical protein
MISLCRILFHAEKWIHNVTQPRKGIGEGIRSP